MAIDIGKFSAQLVRLFRFMIAVGALTASLTVAGCANSSSGGLSLGDFISEAISGAINGQSAADADNDRRKREAEAAARREAYSRGR